MIDSDEGEACDDGNTINGDGCNRNCQIDGCGDGVSDKTIDPITQMPREQCDDGINDGGYGECAPGCILGPRCGDGIIQKHQGEQCDDGINDGGYGSCAPGCQYGPHCGDGVLDIGYEECDNGNTDETDNCSKACRKLVMVTD